MKIGFKLLTILFLLFNAIPSNAALTKGCYYPNTLVYTTEYAPNKFNSSTYVYSTVWSKYCFTNTGQAGTLDVAGYGTVPCTIYYFAQNETDCPIDGYNWILLILVGGYTFWRFYRNGLNPTQNKLKNILFKTV